MNGLCRTRRRSSRSLSGGCRARCVVQRIDSYRLVLVSNGVCVLRYDNEAGKGDHRHLRDSERPYRFTDPAALLADFWNDVEKWRR